MFGNENKKRKLLVGVHLNRQLSNATENIWNLRCYRTATVSDDSKEVDIRSLLLWKCHRRCIPQYLISIIQFFEEDVQPFRLKFTIF